MSSGALNSHSLTHYCWAAGGFNTPTFMWNTAPFTFTYRRFIAEQIPPLDRTLTSVSIERVKSAASEQTHATVHYHRGSTVFIQYDDWRLISYQASLRHQRSCRLSTTTADFLTPKSKVPRKHDRCCRCYRVFVKAAHNTRCSFTKRRNNALHLLQSVCLVRAAKSKR